MPRIAGGSCAPNPPPAARGLLAEAAAGHRPGPRAADRMARNGEGAMAFAVVGQSIVRDEGPAKVTGAARYTADVPLRGALWAKCLRSPLPHARIVLIDTSRAARLPGVRVALSGAEFPPGLIGRRLRDQPIVARDRVRFVGERVA